MIGITMQRLYWLFACIGLMTVSASFIVGFRYDADASAGNYLFNFILYFVFIAIHMIMTLPVFKKTLYGTPAGTSFERRIFIVISVITWVAVYWLHRPMPGIGYISPEWLKFLGTCIVLLCLFAFFEYANFDMMNGFIGMPGSEMSHSTDAAAPLLTDGSYNSVRHPMYRALILLTFSSLIIHPHSGQLFFAVIVSISFIVFIPFEEKMLLKARGDEYRLYMEKTTYRIFRGLW
jgi:protein-S-isoprenylcysteine O-methyltransferase Ste14